MYYMRRQRQVPNEGWRWLALLIVLINVSFNYVLENYLPGTSVASAGESYRSLFAPASYAHLMWALIGATALIYAIFQLLPAQSEERIYDQLAKPFVLTNAFCIAWIASVRAEIYVLALIFLMGALVSALVM